jgi:hypothetical protein
MTDSARGELHSRDADRGVPQRPTPSGAGGADASRYEYLYAANPERFRCDRCTVARAPFCLACSEAYLRLPPAPRLFLGRAPKARKRSPFTWVHGRCPQCGAARGASSQPYCLDCFGAYTRGLPGDVTRVTNVRNEIQFLAVSA